MPISRRSLGPTGQFYWFCSAGKPQITCIFDQVRSGHRFHFEGKRLKQCWPNEILFSENPVSPQISSQLKLSSFTIY